MIKHMLKIIWNRKQSNLFIFLEILFSFLVLVLISIVSLYFYHNYTQPLGFSIENVWNIQASEHLAGLGEVGSEKSAETLKQYMNRLKGMDEVTGVGLISHEYTSLNFPMFPFEYKGRTVPEVKTFFLSDGCLDVLNIEIIHGRWLDKSDDGAGIAPAIINKRLGDELFSGEDPIGKIIEFKRGDTNIQSRVVGVVSDFRHHGPLDLYLTPVVLLRQQVNDKLPSSYKQLVIKTRPDVKAEFKVKLLNALQPIDRSWSIDISGYEEAQERHVRSRMRVVYSLAVIAIAMVAMAVLGLIAVLWQNVRKRIQEIGLRRAKGATVMNIFQQVTGEFLIVSTFAIALGLFLVAQFQYFDVISFIPDKVYFLGMAISAGVVYILTILITLYPSMSAARIQPAEALHYE
ncbi:MAG: ABC transporter permease [Desulfobacteraceae bacterium]